jgi:hypothetical protein
MSDYYDSPGNRHLKFLQQNAFNVQKTAYSGALTDGARKRMTRCIDLLVQTSPGQWLENPVTKKRQFHKLAFITLTISQSKNITANEAYHKVFKHFLQWFRRTEKVNTYIWKVEVQNRGQIHYHITTPSFIHWQRLRDKWNNLQEKAGFMEEYRSKKGHSDANSTDIHEIRHVKNLSSYLKKEYAKAIQNINGNEITIKELECQLPKMIKENDTKSYLRELKRNSKPAKIWDASNNLTASKYYTIEVRPETEKALLYLDANNKISELTLEQCSVFTGKQKDLLQVLDLKQLKDYDDHIAAIRSKRKDKVIEEKVAIIEIIPEIRTGVKKTIQSQLKI